VVRNALAPFVAASILLLVAPAVGPDAAASRQTATAATRATPGTELGAVSPGEPALRQALRTSPGVAAVQRLRALGATQPGAPGRAAGGVGAASVAGAARGAAPSRPPVRTVAARGDGPARTHRLRSGESLWTVSRHYGVTVEALAAANALRADAVLPVGKVLVIPGGDEATSAAPARVHTGTRRPAAADGRTATYVVQPGDTLWSIAYRHGTTVEALLHLNGLDDPDRLQPGQRLTIAGRPLQEARRAAAVRVADAPAGRAGVGLLWPARGVITSRFGWRRYRYHHNGIDLAAPAGTPVYAASDGVVEFAGWKGGYGRVVYLRHPDGVTTVYAHASALLVQTGQRVRRGQTIARVGCTGACTGPHLHFEVHVDGQPVNPVRYLR
jgi:murein DD-endopeptidase MepM/ murein hydrolase activator NlpD